MRLLRALLRPVVFPLLTMCLACDGGPERTAERAPDGAGGAGGAIVAGAGGEAGGGAGGAMGVPRSQTCASFPEALGNRLVERPLPFCAHARGQDEGLVATTSDGARCCARIEGDHPSSCASLGMCQPGFTTIPGFGSAPCEQASDDGRYAYFHCSGGWICCTPE